MCPVQHCTQINQSLAQPSLHALSALQVTRHSSRQWACPVISDAGFPFAQVPGCQAKKAPGSPCG